MSPCGPVRCIIALLYASEVSVAISNLVEKMNKEMLGGYMMMVTLELQGFRVKEWLSCVFSAPQQRGKARNLALP